MIPFIKSLTELMIITQSRDRLHKSSKIEDLNSKSNEDIKNSRIINSNNNKIIDLPDLPNTKRHKWTKSKEAVSKFFDELDYNNQIQSSYDLTLLENQKNYDQHNVA